MQPTVFNVLSYICLMTTIIGFFLFILFFIFIFWIPLHSFFLAFFYFSDKSSFKEPFLYPTYFAHNFYLVHQPLVSTVTVDFTCFTEEPNKAQKMRRSALTQIELPSNSSLDGSKAWSLRTEHSFLHLFLFDPSTFCFVV